MDDQDRCYHAAVGDTRRPPSTEKRQGAGDAEPRIRRGLGEFLRRKLFGREDAGPKTVDEAEDVGSQSAAQTVECDALEASDGTAPDVESLIQEVTVPDSLRLELHGELARGGMGTIETVFDRSLRRKTAMKLTHPGRQWEPRVVCGIVREAQIMAQLDHPNIVPVHDIGRTEDDRLYFTMKLVEGKSLHEVIGDLPDRPLEPAELLDLLEIVTKICDSLAFAHDRGIVHCDVKPQNVMVGSHGQVYLMDWGLARLHDNSSLSGFWRADAPKPPSVSTAAEPDEETGLAVGTPAYMSPEQACGRPELLDRRVDIFSVGALLYRVLARKPPYRGKTAWLVLDAVQRCDHPPLAEVAPGGTVPAELERIITKAMARDPIDRYQKIEDLKADLVRFMRGGSEFPRVQYAAGEHVVREGDPGDAAYIIQSGRCEVYRERGPRRVSLKIMGPGEVFGETAILTSSARTASVVALEDTVVRVVTREILETEVGQLKPWMGVLVRTLAERFRDSQRSNSDDG